MATLPEINSNIKKNILQKHGWPETYDPCSFDPCRIRFCLTFTRDDDTELKNILEDFVIARQEYDAATPCVQ
jgi:diadenosine tetraphosphatase ApaH/serine/threonine PP2A family protein phosphatase